MFKNANSVTRPDKALILGFMAGYIENPRPSLDNVLVIKLGETKVCFIVLIKVNKKNLISFSENKISNRCVSIITFWKNSKEYCLEIRIQGGMCPRAQATSDSRHFWIFFVFPLEI